MVPVLAGTTFFLFLIKLLISSLSFSFMKVIAFTGLARCGKDTAADYVVKKYGFRKIVMSNELAEELAKQGKKDTKMNRSLVGNELRKKLGDDIVAQRVFEKAKKNGWGNVIFVGPRSISEIEFFKKKISGFKLIAIKAEEGKRFGRRSKKDGQTKETFFERDEHDSTKFELGKVIAMAKDTIENNSTIDEFQKAIDELMQNI